MYVGFLCRAMFAVARNPAQRLANGGRKALVPMFFVQNAAESRNMSTKTVITKNLLLTTTDQKSVENRNSSLKCNSKPLAIILSWLMAQSRHLNKYVDFYLDQGCDVLTVKITPWQLLWPMKGAQIIAQNLLDFVHTRKEYEVILLHSFSVGGYLYGEVLLKMEENPDKYGSLKRKIVGQVFDSPVDYEGIPNGLPNAVTTNPILRKYLTAYTKYHMKTFHNQATQHYLASSARFHDNPVTSPSLFLFSKDDPVATAEGVLTVIHKWEAKGMKVYVRCWDSSPHVSHMYLHPKEYAEEMKIFLEKIDVLAPSMKEQAINASKL